GDDSRKTDREPNADCFNRQSGPSSDLQADQNVAAIFPPAIRQSERRFPKQADQEKQKKREAERSPVNKPLRGVKKTGRRNERSADAINKIPREAFRRH